MKFEKNTYLLLFLLLTAVYFPLVFNPVPNDFLDCWLPWRHFASKCFHNGIFPLWNPYQQLGYPIYADLQGPVLSVENFITGNLFQIDLTILQLVIFGYIFTAAVGMYKLCYYLYQHAKSAFVIAFVFSCCGMFILHLQHFFSIVSFALFPLTLYHLIKFFNHLQWKSVFALVVLFHLHITTGNQTFNLINLHFLIIAFIGLIIAKVRANEITHLIAILKKTVALKFFVLLSILPTLIAWWQTHHEVARYSGLSIEKASVNSITFKALTSFINPFVFTQNSSWLGTDSSMAACFVGTFVFACYIGYLIYCNHKYKFMSIGLILFFTLLAFGNSGILYSFFYKIDPALHYFRFPAYFMFYVSFIILIGAGFFIKDVLSEKLPVRRLTFIHFILILFPFILILSKFSFETGNFLPYFARGDIKMALQGISFVSGLSLMIAFMFFLLLLFVFSLLRTKNRVLFLPWFIIFESGLIAFICLKGILLPVNVSDINSFINASPKKFQVPQAKVMYDEDLLGKTPKGIWRNHQQFFNALSLEFFNSFYLEKVNGLFAINTTHLKPEIGDSIIKFKRAKGKILEFLPGKIVVEANSFNGGEIQILQMNNKFWQLKMDNKFVKNSNSLLLKAKLLRGNHQYLFEFNNPLIFISFWISYFIVTLSFCLFLYFNAFSKKVVLSIVASVALFIVPIIEFLTSQMGLYIVLLLISKEL